MQEASLRVRDLKRGLEDIQRSSRRLGTYIDREVATHHLVLGTLLRVPGLRIGEGEFRRQGAALNQRLVHTSLHSGVLELLKIRKFVEILRFLCGETCGELF